MDKWKGPALLKVTHTGSANFKIYNLDSNGERINLLVFINGSYDGYLPLDFMDGQQTKSFDITANGTWELQVIPLGRLRVEKIPGTISGVGDDMFIIVGNGSQDQIKVDASQASQQFVVYGIGNTAETPVDEAAPYSGTISRERGSRADCEGRRSVELGCDSEIKLAIFSLLHTNARCQSRRSLLPENPNPLP